MSIDAGISQQEALGWHMQSVSDAVPGNAACPFLLHPENGQNTHKEPGAVCMDSSALHNRLPDKKNPIFIVDFCSLVHSSIFL